MGVPVSWLADEDFVNWRAFLFLKGDEELKQAAQQNAEQTRQRMAAKFF